MNRNEFYNWFSEHVTSRWPKWETNRYILEDWFIAFGRFDRQLLTTAVRQHRLYDDPPAPSTRRLLVIVKSLLPRSPVVESDQSVAAITFSQFREKVLATYSKQERIKLMRSLMKFYPRAKEFDSEAYEWARQTADSVYEI
jgi:hypothetical protein